MGKQMQNKDGITLGQRGTGITTLINFSGKGLNDIQVRKVRDHFGIRIERKFRNGQFNIEASTEGVNPCEEYDVVDVVNKVGLTNEDWLMKDLLIILPSNGMLALAIMAEIHYRCGQWRDILVLDGNNVNVMCLHTLSAYDSNRK